ncbi:hypothetical protein RFI_03530, partial [Reticulomyxa filosa]
FFFFLNNTFVYVRKSPRVQLCKFDSKTSTNESTASERTDSQYVLKENLKRCEDCNEALKKCLMGIQSKQWDEAFDSMNTIRSLALFHAETLVPHLAEICRHLPKQLHSLRSSVSRQALITVTDLFDTLQKSMEPHLDSLVSKNFFFLYVVDCFFCACSKNYTFFISSLFLQFL